MLALDPLHLIGLQLELECIGLNDQGLLVRIPGPDPDDIGCCYVYRHAYGYSRFLRHDVPAETRTSLLALPVEAGFERPETLLAVLRQNAPRAEWGSGSSYVFPETLAPADFADVSQLGETHRSVIHQFDPHLSVSPNRPIQAILVDGQIVSACVSARENDWAAEAWVQTRPGFRRRGFARQVTAAWAHQVRRQGKVPFYSHRRENVASRAVAKSLGLIWFVDYAVYQ